MEHTHTHTHTHEDSPASVILHICNKAKHFKLQHLSKLENAKEIYDNKIHRILQCNDKFVPFEEDSCNLRN